MMHNAKERIIIITDEVNLAGKLKIQNVKYMNEWRSYWSSVLIRPTWLWLMSLTQQDAQRRSWLKICVQLPTSMRLPPVLKHNAKLLIYAQCKYVCISAKWLKWAWLLLFVQSSWGCSATDNLITRLLFLMLTVGRWLLDCLLWLVCRSVFPAVIVTFAAWLQPWLADGNLVVYLGQTEILLAACPTVKMLTRLHCRPLVLLVLYKRLNLKVRIAGL